MEYQIDWLKLCIQSTVAMKMDVFWYHLAHRIEAVVQRCSIKKVLLEISQNSQENTCLFLIKGLSFLISLKPFR